MPRWIPEKVWAGKDVFIIGGGVSLKEGFDWNLLIPEYTIGCNNAYELGVAVCKICFFGDHKWFKVHEKKLADYKGTVFTSVPQLQKSNLKWLWFIKRESRGLHFDALGWNYNTGASAINLALLLGAKRIFLLGFDMHLSKEGESNWHINNLDKPNKLIFAKFNRGFQRVAFDLGKKFPGCEIINITKDSSLNMFQKVDFDVFWKERRQKN